MPKFLSYLYGTRQVGKPFGTGWETNLVQAARWEKSADVSIGYQSATKYSLFDRSISLAGGVQVLGLFRLYGEGSWADQGILFPQHSVGAGVELTALPLLIPQISVSQKRYSDSVQVGGGAGFDLQPVELFSVLFRANLNQTEYKRNLSKFIGWSSLLKLVAHLGDSWRVGAFGAGSLEAHLPFYKETPQSFPVFSLGVSIRSVLFRWSTDSDLAVQTEFATSNYPQMLLNLRRYSIGLEIKW